MRLSNKEKTDIQTIFSKTKGALTASLFLFGSRVDDAKKGGDIDLLIVFESNTEMLKFNRLDFIVALKKAIGDRRIDVTLADANEIKTDLFLKSVMDSAIALST